MANCSVDFIDAWLDAFRRSRAENFRVVDAFSRRLTAEFDVPAPEQTKPHAEGQGMMLGAGRISLRRLVVQFVRQTRALAALLRKVSPADRNLLIISDTRRLDNPADLNALCASLTPIERTVGFAELERDIRSAPQKLIFSPNLFVKSARQGGFVEIGYLGLLGMVVLRPFSAAGLFYGYLRTSGGRSLNRDQLRFGLLAIVIDMLLEKGRFSICLQLTSYSFVIELMRWRCVLRQHSQVTEILHGVPTKEVLDYLNGMANFIGDAGSASMGYAPSVPNIQPQLQRPNVFRDFAINTKLRAFIADQSREQVSARLKAAPPKTYRVALNGGACDPTPYFQSHLFKVEQSILHNIRQFGIEHQIPIEIWYSVHPAHKKSGIADHFAEKLDVDRVMQDSVDSWLAADLCVALLSSSIWDARYLGGATFIAVNAQDDLYSLDLLKGGGYVEPGETTLQALQRVLECMITIPPLGPEDVERRIVRLYAVEAPFCCDERSEVSRAHNA